MDTSLVSSKFQVVIPKGIRKQMGIRKGQEISFQPMDNELRLVIVPSIDELAGKFPQLKNSPARSELWEDGNR